MEKRLNEKEIDTAITADSHIDASEFEWVGQDLEKMQEIGQCKY